MTRWCGCGHREASHSPAFRDMLAECSGIHVPGDPFASSELIADATYRGCTCERFEASEIPPTMAGWTEPELREAYGR